MLEKGDERATNTRWPKPNRSAGLNVQGEETEEDAATALPDGAATRQEGSNGQKRRKMGRVRCSCGELSGWFER